MTITTSIVGLMTQRSYLDNVAFDITFSPRSYSIISRVSPILVLNSFSLSPNIFSFSSMCSPLYRRRRASAVEVIPLNVPNSVHICFDSSLIGQSLINIDCVSTSAWCHHLIDTVWQFSQIYIDVIRQCLCPSTF